MYLPAPFALFQMQISKDLVLPLGWSFGLEYVCWTVIPREERVEYNCSCLFFGTFCMSSCLVMTVGKEKARSQKVQKLEVKIIELKLGEKGHDYRRGSPTERQIIGSSQESWGPVSVSTSQLFPLLSRSAFLFQAPFLNVTF